MMKLKKIFVILPLALASLSTSAETAETEKNSATIFQFSAEVSRTVEKDLMQANIYSRKTGKSLNALTKSVSTNLNKVLETAKQFSDIEVESDGVSNRVNYNNNKIDGWVTEGYITLKSKNFDAMAKVLESLNNETAINSINFSVSPEKMKALEDEMTLDVIKQFQHKASVVQQGLNAKGYTLVDVQLSTPNEMSYRVMPMRSMAKVADYSSSAEIPLEAGKETISATASGKVKFE